MSLTRAEQALDYIYRKLTSGEWPPGQRLSNRKIARETGMSFIPVREAIHRLASQGMVEHHPKLGAFVRRPDRQELEELYDLRAALECHAAATAASLPISAEDLQAMRDANTAMIDILEETRAAGEESLNGLMSERWVAADTAFHLALLRAAGNRRIIKLVGELRIMALIFGCRRTNRSCDRLQGTCAEHGKIITALQDGSAAGARDTMMTHIRRGREAALNALARQRTEEAVSDVSVDRLSVSLESS